MRPIDADALVEQLEADAEHMEDPIAQMFTYAAISDINHMPTIEERKKGEWIPQDYNQRHGNISTTVYYCPKCSVCGCSGDYTDAFCKSCGADMRKGEGA